METKGFQFEIIIYVLKKLALSAFFEYLCYGLGHYKYGNSFSAGTVFILRQILTYKDIPRTERFKNKMADGGHFEKNSRPKSL